MSNVAIVILGIWVCATVGTFFTKKEECFEYSFWATVAIGMGYLLYLTK